LADSPEAFVSRQTGGFLIILLDFRFCIGDSPVVGPSQKETLRVLHVFQDLTQRVRAAIKARSIPRCRTTDLPALPAGRQAQAGITEKKPKQDVNDKRLFASVASVALSPNFFAAREDFWIGA
jgi:hypothetical protein